MALIDASMLEYIFAPSMPYSRDANERFVLGVDTGTIVVDAGVIKVGVINTPNIAPGAVGPSALNIDSGDVPHSSPSIAATDVRDALEEVALECIDRLPFVGGIMAGDIDMGGNLITGLALASADADAMSLERSRILVREGHFYRAPVGFAGTIVPNGALKATWVRATATVYLSSLPAPGDMITINGVTLTFQPVGGPNLIEIGVDVPTTAANAVSEINANTTNTLDGIPLNANVFAVQDSGVGTAFHLVILNEDPPNTPEDGNSKPLSKVSSAIALRSFEGGLGGTSLVEDGMLIPDLFTNAIYLYDRMQPAAPWVDVSGTGTVNATNVFYTGPAIPNVDPSVPDHLQNILISLNTILGAGVTPALHSPSHEFGGADELDLTGMSGLLATAQTPATHALSHQVGGLDELDVGGLSGLLADAQTPADHHLSHQNGGLDKINVGSLSGVLADAQNAGQLQGYAVGAGAPGVSQVLTWNGSAWAPATPGAGTDYDTITGVAGPGLAVNDVVYISASNTVVAANASNVATGPAIGVVVAAVAGVVDIRMFGKVTTFTGLSPGSEYYVALTSGNITTTPPSVVGQYVQPVGIALTATTLLVSVQMRTILT